MKFNSISLKFADINDDVAGLEILVDPPLAEGIKYEDVNFEDQPCIALATRVMAFLSFIKQQEQSGAIAPNGEQGNIPPTIH